jgi:hypothetical protein
LDSAGVGVVQLQLSGEEHESQPQFQWAIMLRHMPQWWQERHLPHSGLQQPQSAVAEQLGAAQLGAAHDGAAHEGAAQPQETAEVQEVPQPQLLPHSLWNNLH